MKTGRNRRRKPPGLGSNRRGKPHPGKCPGYGKNRRNLSRRNIKSQRGR